MANRNFPNQYFAWYNDDQRLAILALDITSTGTGTRTTEKYDTFQDSGNLSGNITSSSTGSGSSVTFTSNNHPLTFENGVGDRIAISGTTSYDGNYTITAVTTNTFTVAATNSESSETGTFASLFVDNGLRMTYKSKYETVTVATEDLNTDIGLDTSLHSQLVCYMKSRLYEDQGNFEQANYFRNMYETQMMKQKSRKSGVRGLAVPNL
jgi:hypothetical protein